MLYIGNFSYTDTHDDEDNYVLLPCVVQADDADEACEQFTRLLERTRRQGDLLDGARTIYLDSLVELSEAPSEPVLVQWQKVVPSDEGLCTVCAALPDPPEGASAYTLSSDADEGLEEQEFTDPAQAEEQLLARPADPAQVDEEPFLEF